MLQGAANDCNQRHCKPRRDQVAHFAFREVEKSGNHKVADCCHGVENSETCGSCISYT